MRDFKKLQVWQKSHALATAVYKVTGAFPREEIYGLTSQIRRASASIPANIAEGCGRSGEAELCRFLRIAMGSASELEYHILLCRDLSYLKLDEYELLTMSVVEVKKMLATLEKKLRPDS